MSIKKSTIAGFPVWYEDKFAGLVYSTPSFEVGTYIGLRDDSDTGVVVDGKDTYHLEIAA